MTRKTLAEEIQSSPIVPEIAAYLNIIRTADQLTSETQVFLKGHGVTSQQYNVLRILRGAAPAGLPILEIGNRMVTRVPDVTRLVDRMEASGLVVRSRSDQDRRVVRVLITEKGLALAVELMQPIEAVHRSQLGHLSIEELADLNRLLEKARQRDE